MYVITVKMNEKDKNKKTCYVYLFICLVLRISFICIVFSLGLVLLVWLSNFMSEQLAFLFTLTPLNFQKRKVNIYDFFATFCFIVVFVSLHQRQLHWRQFTFLKGEGMLFSFILYYFINIFHLNFLRLRQLKKLSKNSAKFIQPMTKS